MIQAKKDPAAATGGVLGGRKPHLLADKNKISDNKAIVNTLKSAFENLQNEAGNLSHGIITLQIHFRDGFPHRYTINREVSFLFETEK